MGKIKTKRTASAKELVDQITAFGTALKSAGHAMGRAVLAARKFGEDAHRVGSAIDRDVRQGQVDDLFAKPDMKIGRGSRRRSPSKRHADSLLDEADPLVDTGELRRSIRVSASVDGFGFSAQEAADALSQLAGGGNTTAPVESRDAQRPAQAATGPKKGEVKEVRCKIGERQLRDEDNTTGSESDS